MFGRTLVGAKGLCSLVPRVRGLGVVCNVLGVRLLQCDRWAVLTTYDGLRC